MNQTLMYRNQRATKLNKSIKKKLDELQQHIDYLLDENEELHQELNACNIEREDYRKYSKELEEENKRKERLINDLDTIIKEYDEENERLKNDYKVLANYNLDLLDELEKLEEENKVLKELLSEEREYWWWKHIR